MLALERFHTASTHCCRFPHDNGWTAVDPLRTFAPGFFSSRRNIISSSAMMQRSPCRLLPVICPAYLVCSAGHGGVRMDATRAADGCRSGDGRSAGAIVGVRLTFASGLAIVPGHNVWSDPAAAVVSLLGWMMTIKGAALLLVPAAGWTALLGAMHYPSHSGVYTIIPGLAGAYLTYSGFARQRQQRAGRESAQRP